MINYHPPQSGGRQGSEMNRTKAIRKIKYKHSSRVVYGTNTKDFIFLVQENVFYANFKLHGKFIDQQSQHQTKEQPLPAWLAD